MFKKISKQIEKIRLLRKERNRLERTAMKNEAMVAASFISRKPRPDAPQVYYLSASIDGQSRHRYVRKNQVEYWRKRAGAWRRFSQAMASVVKLNRQIEQEVRNLGRLRCEQLPGEGRRRKGGRKE